MANKIDNRVLGRRRGAECCELKKSVTFRPPATNIVAAWDVVSIRRK